MSIIKGKRSLHGVTVEHHKNTMDMQTEIMPVPAKVVIPMLQHMGIACGPLVNKGDNVTVGQKIGESSAAFSVPVYSSCSGVVTDIIDYHPAAGAPCKAIVVETDGIQKKSENILVPTIENREQFIAAIKESGLVGLGGAGFPTFMKLSYKDVDKLDSLVINFAECEPYITADYRECLEDIDNIAYGINEVKKYLEIKNVYIGVEKNKPKAIELLNETFKDNSDVSIVTLKTLYPQGAEKSIIYSTTGRIVPKGKLPADAGVIVLNISTIGFIGNYLKTGMPLVEKRITIDGDCVMNPKNIMVPIGTLISDIIGYCDIGDDYCKVLYGGPMMGLPLDTVERPVVKNTNAVTFYSKEAAVLDEPTACIRCGKCIQVCPMNLMPAKLEKAYDTRNKEVLKKFAVDLCINCGCCSYICPAKRHLAQKNQLAKQFLREKPKEVK